MSVNTLTLLDYSYLNKRVKDMSNKDKIVYLRECVEHCVRTYEADVCANKENAQEDCLYKLQYIEDVLLPLNNSADLKKLIANITDKLNDTTTLADITKK